MENNYYVYLHKTPFGEIFYVGKGRNNRAFITTNRSSDWNTISDDGFEVEIYKDNLTQCDALRIETDLIKTLPYLVNKQILTTIEFDDYSDYFMVDPESPSGLVRTSGVFNGLYNKGKIGACGYKAENNGRLFWRVKFKNKSVQVHRIIWELTYGKIPKYGVIDHIDGNALNNLVSNLKLTTQGDNCKNRGKSKNNTSGVTGVSIDKYSVRAMWTDGGCKKSKRFSIGKLGFDIAFQEACDFRRSMVSKQGYTERHGT